MEKFGDVWLFRSSLHSLPHFGGFLVIGGITTLTDISILYVLTEWAGFWFLYSAFISYTIGALLSYVLNRTLNFKNKSPYYLTQGAMFLAISGCSLIFNLGVVYGGVEWAGISYMYAKILATGAGFILNYAGQTIITFRNWR